MYQNPFASNPYGSPYPANPMYGMQSGAQANPFQMANFYAPGANLSTPTGTRDLPRRALDDYKTSVRDAAVRESVYGASGDPRIIRAATSMHGMGVMSDNTYYAMQNQRLATQARQSGNQQFTGYDMETGARQSMGTNNTLANDEMRRTATRARIQTGSFINNGFGAKLFGGGFGNSEAVADSADALIHSAMARNPNMFGGAGTWQDVRGRGVLQRDMTNALLEGMGDGKGGFDSKYGSAEESNAILKAFARGGTLDMDTMTKRMVDSSGQAVTQVDTEAIKNQVLPKVKMMVDTLDTLSETYGEMDPEKLMRVAAEITGLNPNDIRNAKQIKETVGQLTAEADQFGLKTSEYMNTVVGTAQHLTKGGFGQQSAGIFASHIVAQAASERQSQLADSDLSKGGFRAMTLEDHARKGAMREVGMMRDQGPETRMGLGLMEVLREDKTARQKGGKGFLSTDMQDQLQEALDSGDSEKLRRAVSDLSTENGINVMERTGDLQQRMQMQGLEGEMMNFSRNTLANRNAQNLVATEAHQRGWLNPERGGLDPSKEGMLGSMFVDMDQEHFINTTDRITALSGMKDGAAKDARRAAMIEQTSKELFVSDGFTSHLKQLGLGESLDESDLGNFKEEDINRIAKDFGIEKGSKQFEELQSQLGNKLEDGETIEGRQAKISQALAESFATNMITSLEGKEGTMGGMIQQKALFARRADFATRGEGLTEQNEARALRIEREKSKDRAHELFGSSGRGSFISALVGESDAAIEEKIGKGLDEKKFTEDELREGKTIIGQDRDKILEKASMDAIGDADMRKKLAGAIDTDATLQKEFFGDDDEAFKKFHDRVMGGKKLTQKDMQVLKGVSRYQIGEELENNKLTDGSSDWFKGSKKEAKELQTLNDAFDAMAERLGDISQAQSSQTVKFAEGTTLRAKFDKDLQTMILEAEKG